MFSEGKRIIYVDVSALSHAAWHAYPPQNDAEGKDCRVINGVFSKLSRLARSFEWDLLVATFDSEGGSLYRKAIYPGYKAHRPEKDPDFVRQNNLLPELMEPFGMGILRASGEESDDLIGSAVRLAKEAGCLTMILTADKDLAQLVDDGVWLLRPIRGEEGIQNPFASLNRDGVKEAFGVWPEQIADYLALLGDSSDNIPGVPKVGAKTAAKWLAEHGTLEGLLTHAESIKGVVGENLRQSRDSVLVAKTLTQIQTELAIDEASHRPRVDWDAVDKIAEKYAMPHWFKELAGVDPRGAGAEDDPSPWD